MPEQNSPFDKVNSAIWKYKIKGLYENNVTKAAMTEELQKLTYRTVIYTF